MLYEGPHTYSWTTLNPSMIDEMVDSCSKQQKPAWNKLPSSGNLFLVRVVIINNENIAWSLWRQ